MATKWVHQIVAPVATAPMKLQARRVPVSAARRRRNRRKVMTEPIRQRAAASPTSQRLWSSVRQVKKRMEATNRGENSPV